MTSFDFLVQTELEHFENSLDVALSADVELVNDIARYMAELKGKRLRPVLALLSAKAVQVECRDNIIDAAVAVEMIHAATMVHDDVVDSAKMRRGSASINEKWSGQVAVLMGDFLLAKALNILVEIGDLRALSVVSKATQRLSVGEIFEIQIGEQHDVRESSYFSMVNDKTASLISASVCLGPIFSKADESVIASMRKYGELLGAAFQIADDILDYTGDSVTMGKPVGHDLREGKITLPLIRALQRAPLENRHDVKNLLSKKQKTEIEWEQIVTFVEEFSGVLAAEATAREYSAKALKCLEVLPETPEREALELAVKLVVERKS